MMNKTNCPPPWRKSWMMKIHHYTSLLCCIALIGVCSTNLQAQTCCDVNVTTPFVSGCCVQADAPTSSCGDIEYLWARNDGGSISYETSWTTDLSGLEYCPTTSGYYRLCSRVAGCTSPVVESSDVYLDLDNCITPNCTLAVDLGPDQELCNTTATLVASVSGQSSCEDVQSHSRPMHSQSSLHHGCGGLSERCLSTYPGGVISKMC